MSLLNLVPIGMACSDCGAFHDRDNQRLCPTCHAGYQRRWRRKRTREFRKAVREASNVHLAAGKIAPGPCTVCGGADAELHHPDHEMPELTVWLCRRCHMLWHSYWKTLVLNTFAEWLSFARDGAAVRKATAPPNKIEIAA